VSAFIDLPSTPSVWLNTPKGVVAYGNFCQVIGVS
jgi:hypothetical protein